ncbi:N-6 DNA methylase [Ralstonia pseudosolanacearum]|uniref:type I restriction-modification system subunit M n=1 Tax=Ralstonia pseudosolanacearum TaxID=1310165 RepID=UPI0007D759C6|nr:class I SAM-dependent DNA methyltransferase [Ralstonia pseudosolanacearum]MDC6292790.1 N-6 DNA methylase [Ralstonia pseudosolanacearum]MDD7787944.1 N-6 DNA methylase [Ralstonia pseudosolanacearum]MDN3369828.1 N-6 DNA methylase [Ralstonia pseudosolanacearum]OAK92567.1 type I restriction-modification protein subunit M [Ralstonia pseudosolanacearum]QOK86289.1 N-6 DNA methylase [Ralstonia pseudosolanacearum]
MAIKKSDLYASLWTSCDELRGGMDASQYKDYVLVMLFIKYISDKYAGQPFAPIQVPAGASFADMVALKGQSTIGDDINKKIIAPLANANKLAEMPDFNDANKLGTGKEMVERLTNLIAIFENPVLDFSKNRADGDDILGDAYEYLMRHFATDSGKSKGQFYTPAEVSRIMAKILGIGSASTTNRTTVYDPTCGSGSLLLKVSDEASADVTLYGQEKDAATSGLARMNMILHNNPGALIEQGNTLADPKFKDGEALKTFDYVIANPPFSDKRWSTGLDPLHDPFGRFEALGVPPAKQGDYAYLLHIVRSLKSTGKGACILPHGVLFRGNAEADIRRNLILRGYIKGIIGLPANLFYGTGIPACIVVIDKQDAQARRGIFMLDASQGFMKDGPKNRLREQDIHKIVDVFTRQDDSDPRYARMVSLVEIEQNDYNLNLPRYIDSSQAEDMQDIEGHLKGGIPAADVDGLARYWAICPQLKAALFTLNRPGYLDLAVDKTAIKTSIYSHAEFEAFIAGMNRHFAVWRNEWMAKFKALAPGLHPKQLIVEVGESLLAHYASRPLIDAYDIYQHLLDYWFEVMQDDCYLIAADGWKATTYRVIETKKGKDGKPGKQVDKGWACDLVPKPYIVARYFAAEQAEIDQLGADLETASANLAELEEEYGGEDDVFAGFDKINAASVKDRVKEIGKDASAADELAVLKQWLELAADEAELKKRLKEAEAGLDAKAYAHYPKLSDAEVQTLVAEDKWLAALDATIHGEMDRVSQSLTRRVKELAERYEAPLPQMVERVAELEAKVSHHLEQMGFAWK